MPNSTELTELLRAALTEHSASIVHVGIFDLFGIFRQRRFHASDLVETAAHARFVNCLPEWDCMDHLFGDGPFLSERITFDVSSMRPMPFEPGAVFLVADYLEASSDYSSRGLLQRQLAKIDAMGIEVRSGYEFEFIMLDETAETVRTKGFDDLQAAWIDNRCWSGHITSMRTDFVRELEAVLGAADVPMYMFAGEYGPGTFEATTRSRGALRAADDAAFFRQIVRTVSRRSGRTASFMAQLGSDYPGIGGHVNVSFHDKATGKNLFAGSGADGTMSEMAGQFIAGMIQVVPEAFPLCAHTVNAYRRLALGSWAPKTVSWGPWNYAAAVRTVPEPATSARLEFRLPGADCNVHLSLALMLAAGVHGIENNLVPPAPINSGGPNVIPAGVPQLPHDLFEATKRMQASSLSRALFGATFVDRFAKACFVEDEALQKAVSNEERRRYLEAG
jgi:glutamine synthetase